ncbi:glycosyltransferase [Agrilutibacter solisilvae]|uniref:Glycosyltransferase n=1 Tax=Agrilutibacter solisilvae TaxID=2763317 RepID=A0A974Y039_9GAMM|nr:glycosyltransferase [Lysobacter solisilvae]QSX78947.1 glycosyltransferase [Lysobacter solisilvae]
MKILFTNFHEGDGGGHTTYVVALARGLAGRHEVHVAAPEGSRLLREAREVPGVTALAQAFPNGLRELAARRRALQALAARLRAEAYDVVHVNGSADHRLVLAAMGGLPRRPKLVLTKHNSKPLGGFGHAWRARSTDQVIAVCDFTLRQLRQSAYRRCALATVHNGIDVAHFSPWPEQQALAERQRWFGDFGGLVLGSTAGTAAYKGWMDLVEALALLPADARAQVRVLMAGKPPGAEQVARIDALGLASQVVFTGLLTDVRPAVAAIDAGFVLSYDVETISFACREMMAMGKPVLLSDYAGLPENVAEGREGWVVPVRDRRAIAAAVEKILALRPRLPAMGAAARERAAREFGIELFVERTLAVYAAVLGMSAG